MSKQQIIDDPRFDTDNIWWGNTFTLINTGKIKKICKEWIKHAAFKEKQKRSVKITPEAEALIEGRCQRYEINAILRSMGYELAGDKGLKHIANNHKVSNKNRKPYLLLKDYKDCISICESIYWDNYKQYSHTFGKNFSTYPRLWKVHMKLFRKTITKKEFTAKLRKTARKLDQPYILYTFNQEEINYGPETRKCFDGIS